MAIALKVAELIRPMLGAGAAPAEYPEEPEGTTRWKMRNLAEQDLAEARRKKALREAANEHKQMEASVQA